MVDSNAASNTPRSLVRVGVPALVAAIVLGGGLWLWQSSRDVAGTVATSTTADQVPVGVAAVAPDRVEQLLLAARSALNERRLLAPAGDSAIENYLAVLDLEANNVAARQALLELIPPASEAVEGAIASGELDEARRRFELFRRMGVSELRLSPIRAQLAAAEASAERAAVAAAEAADAAANPPEPPPATPPATAQPTAAPAPAVATAAPPSTPARPSAAVPAPPVATTTQPADRADSAPTTAAAEPAPVIAIVEPRQTVDVRPAYPAMAKQRRVEGWVELEFAIGSDGSVDDIRVVGSEPPRIFDREALRAAQRWRFEPRRENGVAVATRGRKTLNFKLGAG